MHKLYKSDTDKMLDGVCGGIAQHFRIDPVIVRLLWVVGTIIGHIFWGIVAYLVAMMIIPRAPYSQGSADHNSVTIEDQVEEENNPDDYTPDRRKTHIWMGVGLIVFGALFLLQNIAGFHVLTYLGHLFPYVWPSVLIILGIMLMLRSSGKEGN